MLIDNLDRTPSSGQPRADSFRVQALQADRRSQRRHCSWLQEDVLQRSSDRVRRRLVCPGSPMHVVPAVLRYAHVRDTVASVGSLVSKTLPFVANNTTIKTFRHALALDEVHCQLGFKIRQLADVLCHSTAPSSALISTTGPALRTSANTRAL